jgi:hypothetical protein
MEAQWFVFGSTTSTNHQPAGQNVYSFSRIRPGPKNGRFPTGPGDDDLTSAQLAEVSVVLAAPVDQLLSMFLPRRSK